MSKPRVFIGSSSESKPIADQLQERLADSADVDVWDQNVFTPNTSIFESLIEIADKYDFAVFVFAKDDDTIIRGRRKGKVRDNVLFEYGIFAGRLGKDRVVIVMPESSRKSKVVLPSDLLGVCTLDYSVDRLTRSRVAALNPIALEIRSIIERNGRRVPMKVLNELLKTQSNLALLTKHLCQLMYSEEFRQLDAKGRLRTVFRTILGYANRILKNLLTGANIVVSVKTKVDADNLRCEYIFDELPDHRRNIAKASGGKPETIRTDSSVSGRSFETGQEVFVSDVDDPPQGMTRKHLAEARKYAVKSVVCRPLFLHGQVVGVLKVDSPQAGALVEDDAVLKTVLDGLVAQFEMGLCVYDTAKMEETKTLS